MKRKLAILALLIILIDIALIISIIVAIIGFLLSICYLLYKKEKGLIFLLIILFIFLVLNFSKIKIVQENSGYIIGKVINIQDGRYNKKITLSEVYFNDKYIGKSILLIKNNSDIKLFHKIETNVIRINFEKARCDGNFDEESYYHSINIFNKFKLKGNIKVAHINFIDSIRYSINNHIENLLNIEKNPEIAGVYKALTLGKRDESIVNIKKSMDILGLSHILAISGLHITLVGMTIYKLLKKISINDKLSRIISVSILFIYISSISDSISIRRAFMMFLLMQISYFINRTYDSLTAVSFIALIEIVLNPYIITNISMVLSYGITFIVICIYKSNRSHFRKLFDASFLTLPITCYYFYKIPVLIFISTLIFVPISTLIIIILQIAIFTSFINIHIGIIFIYIAKYISSSFIMFINLFSRLEFSTILVGRISIFTVVLAYTVFYLLSKQKKRIYFLSYPIIFLMLITRFESQKVVDILDVGQGDCNVVRYKDITYMIDCGSVDIENVAKKRVIPYLNYHAIDKIDYVYLSHMHFDHYSGIIELIEEDRVKNLVLTYYDVPTEAYFKLVNLAKLHDIKIHYIEKGSRIRYKNMDLVCLHPFKGYVGTNPNSYSMTIKLNLDGKNILFTGDIEEREEGIINASKVNILKVPHHGSNTSSTQEFLDIVRPDFASISCGINNKFNHPSEDTIYKLEKNFIKYHITSKIGQISYIIDDKIKVKTYIK